MPEMKSHYCVSIPLMINRQLRNSILSPDINNVSSIMCWHYYMRGWHLCIFHCGQRLPLYEVDMCVPFIVTNDYHCTRLTFVYLSLWPTTTIVRGWHLCTFHCDQRLPLCEVDICVSFIVANDYHCARLTFVYLSLWPTTTIVRGWHMCTFLCGQRLPFEQVHLEHKYTVWTRRYCVEQTHIKQIPKIEN